MLDNNTVNIAIKLVHALAKTCRLYMIVGNHDAYLKDSIDINSLNIFRQEENVRIIDKAEQIDLNGQTCLLAPWLTDMTTFEKNMFDIMIGHFEVSSKYLIQSYVDDHSAGTKASSSVISEISKELPVVTTDLIGSFVDAVKPTGIIYAGHIHKRRECISRGRKFIFIGAPYQQTMGESGDRCGFYVLDEHNAPTFMEISDVPKYMQLNMSDLITDEFDFAIAAGNIVQRIYDVEVSRAQEITVQQKLDAVRPYEEILPDYLVKPDHAPASEDSTFSVDAIRKSKLDYIKNYVMSLSDDALSTDGIDKSKLFEILKHYYDGVIGD